MADLQLILTIKQEEIDELKQGLLEVYPNTSADEGEPKTDDQWFYALPAKIISNLGRDGLKRILIKQANQANSAITTPSVEVILPDGSIVGG